MMNSSELDRIMCTISECLPSFQNYFNKEKIKHKRLLSIDESRIGKILKCHLLVEEYLDEYLRISKRISNIEKIELRFYQKIMLLPDKGSKISLLIPGLIQLNKVRNKYGHNIEYKLKLSDVDVMSRYLENKKNKEMYEDPFKVIEDFTIDATTKLIIGPDEVKRIIMEAFLVINDL